MPVRLKTAAPLPRVKHSTTEPLRFLKRGLRTLSFNNSCLFKPLSVWIYSGHNSVRHEARTRYHMHTSHVC